MRQIFSIANGNDHLNLAFIKNIYLRNFKNELSKLDCESDQLYNFKIRIQTVLAYTCSLYM